MRNILLTLGYDGTEFHGWQRQPGKSTIQGALEAALEKILGGRAAVWGSGRTDAGVHAAKQVANFKTQCAIPCANLVRALNDILPRAIRVKEAREVAADFHARYHVRSKTYRYRILQAEFCSPFITRFVWHYPHLLDRARMAEAARLLEGERDFTSFAGAVGAVRERPTAPNGDETIRHDTHCGPTEMTRTIFSSRILWRPQVSMLVYEVRGSGFLHHMVRNILGTLVEVGKGKLAPRDFVSILDARDRARAGPAVPAQGLCLVDVEY